MNEKIMEKLNDQEFASRVIRMETKEEVIKAFSDEGIAVTDEEVTKLGEVLKKIINELKNLSESELESIAGGDKEDEQKKKEREDNSIAIAAIKSTESLGRTVAHALSDIFQARYDPKQPKGLVHQASQSSGGSNAAYVAIPVLVIAAAGGLYYFRDKIKNLWHSK